MVLNFHLYAVYAEGGPLVKSETWSHWIGRSYRPDWTGWSSVSKMNTEQKPSVQKKEREKKQKETIMVLKCRKELLTTSLFLSKLFSAEEKRGLLFALTSWNRGIKKQKNKKSIKLSFMEFIFCTLWKGLFKLVDATAWLEKHIRCKTSNKPTVTWYSFTILWSIAEI